MEAKAVVIEVRKCDKYGKMGKVVAEVESVFLASAMASGLREMVRGDIIGYTYCRMSHLRECGESYGFMLVQ